METDPSLKTDWVAYTSPTLASYQQSNQSIKMATIKAINAEMNKKIYSLIEGLAENYGFDADEAAEWADNEGLTATFMVKEAKVEKAKPSPLEQCRKNVALWTKKQEADKFDDDEAREKHAAKLDKEVAKLAKLEGAEEEEKPAPKKAAAKAKEEEKPAAKKAPAKPKEEEKPVKAPAKAKEEEKKEKRIARFSPVLSKQLAEKLEKFGAEMSDKMKKEFSQYVDDLSDEDFKAKGLTDHMRDFAESKGCAGTGLVASEEEKESITAPVQLTMEELLGLKLLASVEPVGTFWDGSKGRFVKGPDAVPDEDVAEVSFEGKDYGVGVKSGRVYLEVGEKDVFQGFAGVGKFKEMPVPDAE